MQPKKPYPSLAEKITTGKAGNTRIIFEAAVILFFRVLSSGQA